MDGVTAPIDSGVKRSLVDRCPGALRPHRAADGALVRLRLPGGRITAAALAGVAAAAEKFGNGQVQLTSRGNLQLRGVSVDATGGVPDELVDRISAAGLLPSATHELVRNIVCSPLTGRIGGLADLRPLVTELDQLICRTSGLAGLPGRFLFGLDDGRGDIVGVTPDLGVRAISPERAVLAAGGRAGPEVGLDSAAGQLIALALSFLQARTNAGGAPWHVRDLPDGGASLLDDLAVAQSKAYQTPPATQLEHGILLQDDGRLLVSLVVPLGLLNAGQVAAVAAVSGPELIVTPWRGLVLPDLASVDPGLMKTLTNSGLSLDSRSGWSQVSACTGAPGCVNAYTRTQPVAVQLAELGGAAAGLPVHVVACERRCGSPTSEHVEVLLGSSEWRVLARSLAATRSTTQQSGMLTEMSTLASAVASARNGS